MRLTKAFFDGTTEEIARRLIGAMLVHESEQGLTSGRIVETEAYLAEADPASHSARGQTPRNAAMFGRAGHAYVYFIYGMYECMNVVTGPVGRGEAVLIRALEPKEGVPLMLRRRGIDSVENLCTGPGKLTIAMGITRALNGTSLFRGPLRLTPADSSSADPKMNILASARVGVSTGQDLPLRFRLSENRFVSRSQ
ncbi:MAG: DNA-3-methyladenine glycosylase [Deltaproteobacteria bacterium]|nr:DNA-3-methyladenine glycosylase [Deltaproteobacteria bacterium]